MKLPAVLFAVSCVLGFCLLLPCGLAARAEPERCSVVQLGGPLGAHGEKLRLSFSSAGLQFEYTKEDPVLRIPPESVTELRCSSAPFSRSDQVLGKHESSLMTHLGPNPMLLPAAAVSLGLSLLLGPAHGTSHFILLTWKDGSVDQQMQFEMGKSDLPRFTAALRPALGSRWVDGDEMQKRLEQTIREHAPEAVAVTLARDSRCGGLGLRAGAYRVLPLPIGDREEAEVYFFSEEPGLRTLKGFAQARITSRAANGEAIQYAPGSSRVVSLAWKDRQLDFDGF